MRAPVIVAFVLALALATLAAAETLTETDFACREIADLKDVLALSGDAQVTFYRSKLDEDKCTRMVKAETVKVLARDDASGFVKFETAYGGEKYWIKASAVGE